MPRQHHQAGARPPNSADPAPAPGLDLALQARFARFLNPALFVAAVATIPVIVLYQADLGAPWNMIAVGLDWASWLVFAAEIALMAGIAGGGRQWLRAHKLDVAITLVTFPLIGTLFALLRLTRLVRLARAARLVRLVRAGAIARHWFSPVGLAWTAFIALLAIITGAQAFHVIESDQGVTLWDGVWWSITTTTTVGYGDVYPQTAAGRVLAICLMVVGIGFVAILTGAVAQRFAETHMAERGRRDETLVAILAELAAIRERLDAAGVPRPSPEVGHSGLERGEPGHER